jgi:hypothetical protein
VTSGTDAIPGGLWYGILGESIVAFAVVDAGKPGLSVLYTWVASGASRGGGVYEATMERGALKVLLPNKSILAVERRGARALAATWTPAPAPSNFGITARRVDPLHGELVPTATTD